jgi:hypothetical protein
MHEVNYSKINLVSTFDNKIPKSILEGAGGRTFSGVPRSGWETKCRRMPPDGSRRKNDTQQQGIEVAVGRKQGWPWSGNGPNGHRAKKKKKKKKEEEEKKKKKKKKEEKKAKKKKKRKKKKSKIRLQSKFLFLPERRKIFTAKSAPLD